MKSQRVFHKAIALRLAVATVMMSFVVSNAFAAFMNCYYGLSNTMTCNEYATAADSASLSITGDITVEAYVNVQSFGVPMVVVSKRKNVTNGGGYELWIDSTGHVNFSTYSNSATRKATIQNSNTIATSTWVHIGGEYSTGGTIKALYNGNIASASAPSSAPDNGVSELQIGRLVTPGGSGMCFTGSIDDIRISNNVRYTGSSSYTVPTSYPLPETPTNHTAAAYLFNVENTPPTEGYQTDKSGSGNTLMFNTGPGGGCPGVF